MKTRATNNFKMKISDFERYKLEKRYRFFVGVSLSSISLLILLLIVTVSMPVTVQQAVVVILGLVVLNALDAFRKCLEETVPASSPASSFKIFGNTYHIHNDYTTYSDTYNTYNEKQDLAQAAVEIQELLNKLSQTYPTKTEEEKMVLAEEVVEEIQNNPPLNAKVVRALQAGRAVALEASIDHPAIAIVMAAFRASVEGMKATEETQSSSEN